MSINQAETFHNLAAKFRKLAEHTSDEATAENLLTLADECEQHSERPAAAASGPIPATLP